MKSVLVILLILIVGAAAYYAGSRHVIDKYIPGLAQVANQAKNAIPTVAPTLLPTAAPSQSSQDVVTAFYETYTNCLKNPPTAAKGKVSTYCQNNTGLTTSDFAANIAAGGTAKAGADPIVCAQNPPANIQVASSSAQKGTSVTVNVFESYGAGTKVTIPVTVRLENNQWRIANIVCPKP